MEEVKKEDCQCEQLLVIKKGFNGFKAVSTFIGIAIFFAIVIWVVISDQNYDMQLDASISNKYGLEAASHPNYLIINSALISIAGIASFLGLFAGTIDMNKLFSVCPKCGKVKELTKKKNIELQG